MAKITLSYEEYEKMENGIKSLNMKLSKLPSEKELLLLSGKTAVYFASMFSWIIEDSLFQNNSDGEYSNRVIELIDDALTEYTIPQKKISLKNYSMEISYFDYELIYTAAKQVSFIRKGAFPTLYEIEQIFVPSIHLHFGFILTLLLHNPQLAGTTEYQILKNLLLKCFRPQDMNHDLCIPYSEVEKARAISDTYEFERNGWWPTMEEVKNIIIPNFSDCYDFVLWLTNEKPKKLEEKMVASALRDLLDKHLKIYTKNPNLPWIDEDPAFIEK